MLNILILVETDGPQFWLVDLKDRWIPVSPTKTKTKTKKLISFSNKVGVFVALTTNLSTSGRDVWTCNAHTVKFLIYFFLSFPIFFKFNPFQTLVFAAFISSFFLYCSNISYSHKKSNFFTVYLSIFK